MKCDEAQELFGDYWDLPEHDIRRRRVDEHLKECRECAEEFEMWQESLELIQSAAAADPLPISDPHISKDVMSRIYAEESWRMPVPDRVYSISYRMRKKLTAVVAFCMALFMVSFLYSLVYDGNTKITAPSDEPGVMDVANALSLDASGMDGAVSVVEVASLSDEPVVLKMTAVPTVPDYYIVLSILGLVGALLIMNWLSRTKV